MALPLRTPFLVASLVFAFIIISVETGTSISALSDSITGLKDNIASLSGKKSKTSEPKVSGFKDLEKLLNTPKENLPGLAASSLLSVDILLFVTILLLSLPLIMSADALCRVQGIIYLITGIIMIVLSYITILKAIVSLVLMISLLMAIPFGTIIYMILFAFFDTSKAALIIHTLFSLKMACAICLIIASEFFIANIGLILIIATSFVTMIIVNVLHSFPPTFLVAITDSIAAIIVSIVAIIWAIILIISGLINIIKALKTTLDSATS